MSDAMATRIAGVIVYSVLNRLRLPVTIVTALVVAEAAVFLMRPRDRLAPVDVSPQTYFSTAFIDRAHAFRAGQLWLYGAQLAIELGVLVFVVRRPPALLKRSFRRPVIAGAVAAASLSVVITVATLPVSVISRQRAKDVGLVTQGWVGYARDVVVGTAISAVIVAAGGALLVFLIRRFGRRWWLPATAVTIAFGVISIYAGPIVIDPVFNTFKRLPNGELRSTVLDLARRADVKVGQVYVMDASRRTTAANAYVTGLGSTKRVVLFDTLLDDFTPNEVEGVVAHELGHVHHHDVPHGLLYLAIVAPFGMLAVARLSERLAPRGAGPVVAIPAVALAITVLVPAVTAISNQLSRDVEARADRFSMELTHNPQELIAFQKRITVQNVGDPDPPGWVTFLLATHPTPMQRIGQALAFERRLTPPRAARDGGTPGGS
jgi:STE24 endopeptidase